MQITLRKANAVQLAINEALKENPVLATFSMDEFADAKVSAEAAREVFDARISLRERLLDALYEIRKSVSSLNAQTGIDSLLADVARLDKDIDFFAGLSRHDVAISTATAQAKLEKIRNRVENTYYAESSVSTSVFSKEDIADLKKKVKNLKREKQKIQDKLLELNVSSIIILSASTVQTLTEQDLL